jgi:spore coat polysaccharide biosynthesis protein SpsF
VNIVVVIQARTGSSRLPNKVLMPLAGRPLLERMIERVRAATTPGGLVVATTTEPGDEPIRELCRSLRTACYSGHPTDLLDRHLRAGHATGADCVVKIPSDCPLVDPAVIDRVITFYIEHHTRFDFVSNLHPATYPDGNDVEVIPLPALETAWREATRPLEREHTTPFLWEHPERFRIGNVEWETGLDYSMNHRWTIDYPEDYAFLSAVYDALWSPERPVFSLSEILEFLDRNPSVAALNARYAGVNWYRHHLDELTTISPDQTRS